MCAKLSNEYAQYTCQSQAKIQTLLKEKELWFLIVIGCLFFYHVLFLGETVFFRDLYLGFLPQKHTLQNFFLQHELPLWDSYLHGGQPYLGDIINFTLYPFNIFYRFFPLIETFNLIIVVHLIACLIATYLFCRVLGFHPVSSFIGGTIYGFCGYTLSLINHLSRFLALPYLPLLFLSWHLYWLERKKRWFLVSAIGGLLQVLAGAPEINVITFLLLLAWTIVYPYPSTSRLRRLFGWGLFCVVVLGMSAIQLLPTIEMITYASRGKGQEFSSFTKWSFPLKYLPEIIFPRFFGQIDLFPKSAYWGWKIADDGLPYILNTYWGGLTLLLIVVSILQGKHDFQLPFYVRMLFFLIIISSFLLSFGRFLPFFSVIYHYIPFIKIFRFPVKFLFGSIFPVAILVAHATDTLFSPYKESPPSIFNVCIFSGIVSIGIVALIGGLVLSEPFSASIQRFFFEQEGNKEISQGLIFSLSWTLALWGLFTLLCYYRYYRPKIWQSWFFAGMIFVDLATAGCSYVPTVSKQFFTDIPPLVDTIQHEIGDGRLFQRRIPKNLILQAPSNHIIYWIRWNLELLDEYLSVFYNFPTIFHTDFDGLAPYPTMQLKRLIDQLDWRQKLPILSSAAVTLVITNEKLQLPGLQLINEIPNRSNLTFYLYRNQKAVKRTEFITHWKFAKTEKEAVDMMLAEGYDPQHEVILQQSTKEPNIQNIKNEFNCSPAQIASIQNSSSRKVLSVHTECDGYLVFSEPFYPGWNVYIDGRQTEILKANAIFSAVFLPKGEHNVERIYQPRSVAIGLMASIISLCILTIITYKSWLP